MVVSDAWDSGIFQLKRISAGRQNRTCQQVRQIQMGSDCFETVVQDIKSSRVVAGRVKS